MSEPTSPHAETDGRCSRLRSGYVTPCRWEEAPCQACYEATPDRWPDMAEWFTKHATTTAQTGGADV
jgi:hypothetical protein